MNSEVVNHKFNKEVGWSIASKYLGQTMTMVSGWDFRGNPTAMFQLDVNTAGEFCEALMECFGYSIEFSPKATLDDFKRWLVDEFGGEYIKDVYINVSGLTNIVVGYIDSSGGVSNRLMLNNDCYPYPIPDRFVDLVNSEVLINGNIYVSLVDANPNT